MRIFSRRRVTPHEVMRRRRDRRDHVERLGGVHVEDFVLGANDGIITTFAIVAGATGGDLGGSVIIILGFANLFADGISMGASNYLGKRSKLDYIRSQREMEEWEIEHTPEDEREEVRRIFQDRGLKGGQLDAVVDAVTQDKEAWTDVMMALELGLGEDGRPPLSHGTATFSAFVVAGLVPIVPYLFCAGTVCFAISAAATAAALFVSGALRTLITGVNWLRGGFEMLAVGSAAAAVAYGVGRLIASIA